MFIYKFHECFVSQSRYTRCDMMLQKYVARKQVEMRLHTPLTPSQCWFQRAPGIGINLNNECQCAISIVKERSNEDRFFFKFYIGFRNSRSLWYLNCWTVVARQCNMLQFLNKRQALFQKLNLKMKGHRYESLEAIEEALAVELTIIGVEAFQKTFTDLYTSGAVSNWREIM